MMKKTISLLLMILVVAYSCCSFADSLPSEYVMAGDDMGTNNGIADALVKKIEICYAKF